jgi:hypothetical protein
MNGTVLAVLSGLAKIDYAILANRILFNNGNSRNYSIKDNEIAAKQLHRVPDELKDAKLKYRVLKDNQC